MVTQHQSNVKLKLQLLLTDWAGDIYGSLLTYSRIKPPVLCSILSWLLETWSFLLHDE